MSQYERDQALSAGGCAILGCAALVVFVGLVLLGIYVGWGVGWLYR